MIEPVKVLGKAVLKLKHLGAAAWLGVSGFLPGHRTARPTPEQARQAQSQFESAVPLMAGGEGKRRDIIGAKRLLQSAARLGHPDAMLELGRIYENGLGVERDYIEAGQWYESARRADPDAEHQAYHENNLERVGRLAGRTLRDEQKDEDDCLAALGAPGKVFDAAAALFEAGQSTQAIAVLEGAALPAAQGLAGSLRLEGLGIAPGRTSGLRQLEQAAQEGDGRSQELLGAAYEAGSWGLERSGARALPWYEKAARQGDNAALGRACRLYAQLDGMRRLAGGTYRMADRAVVCYRRLARRGDEAALAVVSWSDAAGLVSDEVKSGRPWDRAVRAVGGVGMAAGLVAMTPVVAIKNPAAGVAAGVAAGAAAVVGVYNAATIFVPRRRLPASEAEFLAGDPSVPLAAFKSLRGSDAGRLRVLRALARRGQVRAQWLLAQAYLDGVGAEADEVRGVEWLRRAAQGGESEAACRLGAWHSGRGTSEDYVQAYRWTMQGCPGQAAALDGVLTDEERARARL